MSILSVKDLSFSYDKKTLVLNRVSLEIQAGTVTALLGKNGSGKSTLLDLLIGIHDPSKGKIYLNGQDRSLLSVTEIARLVAYVPQNSVINMDYSVFEYILFGRSCHIPLGKSPGPHDHEKAYRYAEACGIMELLDKDINKVSGGEKQLAGIARALAQESPLIIMDEPTASLDLGNQARVLSLIRSLREDGKTVLFTTHDPSYVLSMDCDAAVLTDGKILTHGRACETIDLDLLQAIYGDVIMESHVARFIHNV